MLKNRHLRVKLGKDDKDINGRPEWVWTPTDYNDLAMTIARNAASVVAVYIAADTLRKVVIYSVSAKI